MRRYQPNSPEAMARLIGLALLADGGLDVSELNVLERSQVLQRLGISNAVFDQVIRELCEDMLTCLQHFESGQIELDADLLDQLLADISVPRLQRALLSIMLDIVDADQQLTDGEAVFIARAIECWRPTRKEMPPLPGYRVRDVLNQARSGNWHH